MVSLKKRSKYSPVGPPYSFATTPTVSATSANRTIGTASQRGERRATGGAGATTVTRPSYAPQVVRSSHDARDARGAARCGRGADAAAEGRARRRVGAPRTARRRRRDRAALEPGCASAAGRDRLRRPGGRQRARVSRRGAGERSEFVHDDCARRSAAGRATRLGLRRRGVDVDLAPVLDLRGPLGSRHFSRPELGVAFARGLGGRAPASSTSRGSARRRSRPTSDRTSTGGSARRTSRLFAPRFARASPA